MYLFLLCFSLVFGNQLNRNLIYWKIKYQIRLLTIDFISNSITSILFVIGGNESEKKMHKHTYYLYASIHCHYN